MDTLELLNDQYGHCGECHEVHYIPDMVVIDGYYYCKSCSRPTQKAKVKMDKEEFGIFSTEYYEYKTTNGGVKVGKISPVIGNVYKYSPVSLLGEGDSGVERLGIFRGFSQFGPALFTPVDS